MQNNVASPLLNKRVVSFLETIAPEDVQFFPAKVICKDGELEGYQFLNVTSTIVGIDHEKSVYTKMKLLDAIGDIKYLTYKPGCMDNHKIARDAEYLSNILVTEEIKQAFERENITGVVFVRPEDYYRPITAADLIAEEQSILAEQDMDDDE